MNDYYMNSQFVPVDFDPRSASRSTHQHFYDGKEGEDLTKIEQFIQHLKSEKSILHRPNLKESNTFQNKQLYSSTTKLTTPLEFNSPTSRHFKDLNSSKTQHTLLLSSPSSSQILQQQQPIDQNGFSTSSKRKIIPPIALHSLTNEISQFNTSKSEIRTPFDFQIKSTTTRQKQRELSEHKKKKKKSKKDVESSQSSDSSQSSSSSSSDSSDDDYDNEGKKKKKKYQSKGSELSRLMNKYLSCIEADKYQMNLFRDAFVSEKSFFKMKSARRFKTLFKQTLTVLLQTISKYKPIVLQSNLIVQNGNNQQSQQQQVVMSSSRTPQSPASSTYNQRLSTQSSQMQQFASPKNSGYYYMQQQSLNATGDQLNQSAQYFQRSNYGFEYGNQENNSTSDRYHRQEAQYSQQEMDPSIHYVPAQAMQKKQQMVYAPGSPKGGQFGTGSQSYGFGQQSHNQLQNSQGYQQTIKKLEAISMQKQQSNGASSAAGESSHYQLNRDSFGFVGRQTQFGSMKNQQQVQSQNKPHLINLTIDEYNTEDGVENLESAKFKHSQAEINEAMKRSLDQEEHEWKQDRKNTDVGRKENHTSSQYEGKSQLTQTEFDESEDEDSNSIKGASKIWRDGRKNRKNGDKHLMTSNDWCEFDNNSVSSMQRHHRINVREEEAGLNRRKHQTMQGQQLQRSTLLDDSTTLNRSRGASFTRNSQIKKPDPIEPCTHIQCNKDPNCIHMQKQNRNSHFFKTKDRGQKIIPDISQTQKRAKPAIQSVKANFDIITNSAVAL